MEIWNISYIHWFSVRDQNDLKFHAKIAKNADMKNPINFKGKREKKIESYPCGDLNPSHQITRRRRYQLSYGGNHVKSAKMMPCLFTLNQKNAKISRFRRFPQKL